MKRILLGVAAVLVLAGAAAAVAVLTGRLSVPFLGLKAHPRPRPAPVEVTVPTITTNLSNNGGTHFAQVALTVSLRDAAVAKAFNAREAAIENAVIADLRQRSSTQLAGSGGMTGLGSAIASSVDQVLGNGTAVRAVYFTQFVVQ